MATDIVREWSPWEPSRTAHWGWELRRKAPPRRWVSALGTGTYIREARTPAGFLCFRVVFPNGKHCNCDTLAGAQDYAERHAASHQK